MLVELFNILVTIAGTLMSIAHFPQGIKILKRKSAKDVSLISYIIFTLGSYIWLIYGILINELPIIITFIIAVIGTTMNLILILKYK